MAAFAVLDLEGHFAEPLNGVNNCLLQVQATAEPDLGARDMPCVGAVIQVEPQIRAAGTLTYGKVQVSFYARWLRKAAVLCFGLPAATLRPRTYGKYVVLLSHTGERVAGSHVAQTRSIVCFLSLSRFDRPLAPTLFKVFLQRAVKLSIGVQAAEKCNCKLLNIIA
jgi:hypothetical protein